MEPVITALLDDFKYMMELNLIILQNFISQFISQTGEGRGALRPRLLFGSVDSG